MKNLLFPFFSSLIFLMAVSCSSDLNVESVSNKSTLNVTVEDDYLYFHKKADFQNLIKLITTEKLKTLESLEKIEGFNSFNEINLININKPSVENDSEKTGILNPFFEKFVNEKGFVRVENILYQFGDKYIKIVAGYDGSDKMRDDLTKLTIVDKKKNFFISEVKEISFNSKNARSNFDYVIRTEYGNIVWTLAYGNVIPKAELIMTEGRIAIMCENADDPAHTYWFECGYDYYYSAKVRSTLEYAGGGSISGIATSINYSNGSGSGSGYGFVPYSLPVWSAVNTYSGLNGTYTTSFPPISASAQIIY